MNLAEVLATTARRWADRPAVTSAGSTITYAEFQGRSLALAGALLGRLGLRTGDRVLLCMENCGEFLEALFACWAAGLCAVPTNAKLHPREVAFIAANADVRAAFTTHGLHGRLAPALDGMGSVICAGGPEWAALLQADPVRRIHEAAAGEEAWIFYTSGTTGQPKGALLTHRNLLFMSHCFYADVDRLGPDHTKLHAAPLSHASGLYALPHLFRGGHQVVLDGFDAPELLDALARFPKVTLFAAPTMVTRLLDAPGAAEADVRNLRTLYYGGGPMYVANLERALAMFGPRLFQIFGQGESPMTITGLGQDEHARRDLLGTCGAARTGVAVKVVDPEGRELPPGEVGEVVTRSDCVMTGYWNNVPGTAAALQGGWLHTGDLGSMDAEGYLTLRDRSKDMIISGGSNIYPREIEEILLRDPAVLECSVVGRPHAEWGEEAVAFVVAAPGRQVDTAALERLCLDNIARFKRPKAWFVLGALPKNNYGKVLKTELRNMLKEPAQ